MSYFIDQNIDQNIFKMKHLKSINLIVKVIASKRVKDLRIGTKNLLVPIYYLYYPPYSITIHISPY